MTQGVMHVDEQVSRPIPQEPVLCLLHQDIQNQYEPDYYFPFFKNYKGLTPDYQKIFRTEVG